MMMAGYDFTKTKILKKSVEQRKKYGLVLRKTKR